jgi:Arm DNA-binding domain
LKDAGGRRVTCPKAHGSWAWVADVPAPEGQPRRQQTKSGFPTKKDAELALREYLVLADRGRVVAPSSRTLGEYLSQWLQDVTPTLAATASSNYRTVELTRFGGHPDLWRSA